MPAASIQREAGSDSSWYFLDGMFFIILLRKQAAAGPIPSIQVRSTGSFFRSIPLEHRSVATLGYQLQMESDAFSSGTGARPGLRLHFAHGFVYSHRAACPPVRNRAIVCSDMVIN